MRSFRDYHLFMLLAAGLLFTQLSPVPRPNASGPDSSNDIGQSSRVVRVGSLPESRVEYPRHLSFADDVNGMLSIGSDVWRTDDGGKTWTKKSTFGNSASIAVNDLSFVNPQVAWITVNLDPYKSTNGGDSWVPVTKPFRDGSVYSLAFDSTGQRGWVVGTIYGPIPRHPIEISNGALSRDGKSIIHGAIAFTDDGGNTWRDYAVLGVGAVYALARSEAGGVWALFDNKVLRLEKGSWVASDLRLAQGDEWQQWVRASEKGEVFGGLNPLALTFADDKSGWVSYNNGVILKTTDGGRTWAQVSDVKNAAGPLTQNLFAQFRTMVFCSGNSGWAIDSLWHLYHSDDGGVIWEKLESDRKFGDVTCGVSGNALALGFDGIYKITE